jgi:hypothetical protein
MTSPIASLRFSRSMLLTFLGWARHAAGIPRGETAATKPAATVAPRPSPSMTGPAGVIRAALLSLALLCGFASSGNAVTCKTTIPCKEIWFFNNTTNQTFYPVLFRGRNPVDAWLQAYARKEPAERGTAVWATTRDSRVYVNGKTGIPPAGTLINGIPAKGYAKIQLPLFTALLPLNDVLSGARPDSVVDWWNGGRVEIFDDAATIGAQYDIDVALKDPEGVLDPTKLKALIIGNAVVECVEGDCKGVTMIQRYGGDFDNSAAYQLTEFTFGSAQTGPLFATTPYGWVPRDVGYNLSMVDSTYLPVAMEPLNNVDIPYIGSVISPADFRLKMQQWLKDHDGYPIYKNTTLDRPKIPQTFDVFSAGFYAFKDTINPSANLNFNPNNTTTKGFVPGKPVSDMISLYLKCIKLKSTDLTTTCGKLYNLELNLFGPNLTKYMTYPCAVYQETLDSKIVPFPDTVAWRLLTLYGWVPYNFEYVASRPCGNDKSIPPFTGNALFDTPGVTKDGYQQLADSYRLNTPTTRGLQYNYLTETDQTQWFNPYVQLLHSPKYLNMGVYAFSIDDAVGFQQHKGEGLIYAVGGTNGLQNTHELDPNAIVNVAYGYATDGTTYLWQSSTWVCKDGLTHNDDLTEFPSYDFFPLNSGGYPCQVASRLNNGTTKSFGITQGPPNLKIDCSSMYATDPDWCSRITVIGLSQAPLHLDHIIGPAVAKK